ncbi:MAG: NADH-quinone oxidoreductase subunit I [Candidatus Electryoneaceae bacterium]|nr:NADH-quinone oxidoreductase subunit I [Candidatus Electryoneaceae bacterium]
MGKKEVKTLKVDMGVAEKIYWIEVLRGLLVTNNHFMINMGRHILHSFKIKTKEPGAVTYQYPEQKRPIHYRWRGRHRLTVRQDGTTRCTACMLCETICPSDCIHIVPGESTDSNVEKFPEQFTIDVLRCCVCGLCVDACPMDAIRMDVHDFEVSSYTRDIIFTKDFLLGKDTERPWDQWAAKTSVERK